MKLSSAANSGLLTCGGGNGYGYLAVPQSKPVASALVALKILEIPKDPHLRETLETSFPREVKAIQDLNHPNVVAYHGSGRNVSVVALFVPDRSRYLSRTRNRAGPGPGHGACGLKRDLVQFGTQVLKVSQSLLDPSRLSGDCL